MGSTRAELICHPDTPARAVRAVAVEIELSYDEGFALRYVVEGDIPALVLPHGQGELVIADAPSDGLWHSSCFEVFLTDDEGPDYTEFNYAPDGRWACYQFDDYRSLLRPDALAPWAMAADYQPSRYALRVELGIMPEATTRIGLAVVIEESDGTKSYWALVHPVGKPDFHHPDCFALALGAPDAS